MYSPNLQMVKDHVDTPFGRTIYLEGQFSWTDTPFGRTIIWRDNLVGQTLHLNGQ
jgi:hypothetical protein